VDSEARLHVASASLLFHGHYADKSTFSWRNRISTEAHNGAIGECRPEGDRVF
jgi:hypothetical protein